MVKIAELAAELTILGAEKSRAELRAFKKDVLDSGRKLDQAGRKMSDTGKTLQRNLTLPLAVAGGAAIKMSLDYDTSFTKIRGLVGVAADEVEMMKSKVTALSGETARAPVELAEALFTVTSAGFRGQAAIDVLTMAAKGAAVGMGETRTIAESLTASVSAYGPEVLDAARATDILVATVRAGNFEAPQLAASLGQVLPVASAMGVKFEDIGGSVALMTRSNNNASKSITQINALLTAMVKPSAIATEILGKQGLSMADIRDVASGPGGLVEALGMLDDAVGGDQEQLAQLLGSTEANSAALTILNADAETIAGTFGAVANSTGILGDAMRITAESDSFAARQGFAEMQAAALQFADIMLPTALTIINAVSGIAQVFSDLPAPMQNLVTLGIIASAAAGPVLRLSGAVTTMAGSMVKARKAGESMSSVLVGGLNPATVGVAAAAAAAIYVFSRWRGEIAEDKEEVRLFAEALTGLGPEFETLTTAAIQNQLENEGVASTMTKVGLSASDLTDKIAGGSRVAMNLGGWINQYSEDLGGLRGALDVTGDGLTGYTDVMVTALETGAITVEEFHKLDRAVIDLAQTYEKSAPSIKDSTYALLDQLDAQVGLSDASRASYLAQIDEMDSTRGLLEIRQAMADHAVPYGVVLGDEADAINNLTGAEIDLESVLAETTSAIVGQTSALDGLLGSTVSLWGADIQVEDQQARTRDAVAKYNDTLADGTKTTEDAEKARRDAAKAALAEVDAVVAAAEAQAELDGSTLSASDKMLLQVDALTEVAQTLAPDDPLRTQLLGYVSDLGEIPADILTTIGTDVDPAELAEAERLLNELTRHRLASIGVSYTGGGTIGTLGTPTISEAQGGLLIPMAQGGILGERGVSQLADSGANVLFAEEGKGKEAYIAYNDAYRERSMGILGEVADDFGQDLVPKGSARGIVDNSTTNNFQLTVVDRSNTEVGKEFERMQAKAALLVGI